MKAAICRARRRPWTGNPAGNRDRGAPDEPLGNARRLLEAGLQPAVSVLGDTLVNNRYYGVVLDQGAASVGGDTISGGNVGLAVVQCTGQAFAADGTASRDVIRGASVAAVQVASDQAITGDLPA